MNIEIGRIKAIFRYPVKSMAGEQLDNASLGWHGLEGEKGATASSQTIRCRHN